MWTSDIILHKKNVWLVRSLIFVRAFMWLLKSKKYQEKILIPDHLSDHRHEITNYKTL